MYQLVRKITVGFTLFALLSLAQPLTADGQVRFKGNAEGQITSFFPGSDGIAITTLAQGNATHLGLFTREEQIVLNPNTGTVTGGIVFTAANGDQLTGSVAGGFISQTVVSGSYTFTGGTGRFENASGGATFILSTTDGIHFTIRFEGNLN
jgi:hypothetical protein